MRVQLQICFTLGDGAGLHGEWVAVGFSSKRLQEEKESEDAVQLLIDSIEQNPTSSRPSDFLRRKLKFFRAWVLFSYFRNWSEDIFHVWTMVNVQIPAEQRRRDKEALRMNTLYIIRVFCLSGSKDSLVQVLVTWKWGTQNETSWKRCNCGTRFGDNPCSRWHETAYG